MIDRRRVARTILQDERILRAARLGHGRTVVVAILADAGIAAGPGLDDRRTVEITRLFVDRDMIVAILVDRRDAVVAILIDGGREILGRSEEHTSELQSLMRISYAVFCLKKKKQDN